jgi:hypothetical protein
LHLFNGVQGAGIEGALCNNLSWKAGCLYLGLGSIDDMKRRGAGKSTM